ncbi:MAG: DNA polymerase IV [Ktedonobacterales bacterium]|jgi:DNA polymerase-4|nr:MAG: DNA polymerase IV [Ktedonobacterales bacterium]
MNVLPEQGFRRVMHCDLDCFFAAVEELDNPYLAGKPVIVGGDPDRRGVVSTANYRARRHGVHSAMSAAVARRLCPNAVFLRPHFERYRMLSDQVMAILDDYFVTREQVSVDEAYGELPPGVPGCRHAVDIALDIKARVLRETGLIISVGVGRNKCIAKLASDRAKPDGCLIVMPGREDAFLHTLPVGCLPGVGPHTRAKLERMGITLVSELARTNVEALQMQFGKTGSWLWRLAHGEDDRCVVSDHGPPKSLSRECTYERDIADLERAQDHVRALAEKVARDAEKKRVLGRSITLKVKWHNFEITTRQTMLPAPTRAPDVLGIAARHLLATHFSPLLTADHAIRLLGVGLSNLLSESHPGHAQGIIQLPLFSSDEPSADFTLLPDNPI